jgi:hypothetical protein
MARGIRFAVSIALLATLAFPFAVAAAGPVERIIVREHKAESFQVVTDDVCGDVGGGLGLRSGTFTLVETGHLRITVFEDRLHVLELVAGTYSMDFDDPTIPDVSGYRWTSTVVFVMNERGSQVFTHNQHESLPGDPDGIRVWFRTHVTWNDDTPVVEREFFKVTGCP